AAGEIEPVASYPEHRAGPALCSTLERQRDPGSLALGTERLAITSLISNEPFYLTVLHRLFASGIDRAAEHSERSGPTSGNLEGGIPNSIVTSSPRNDPGY